MSIFVGVKFPFSRDATGLPAVATDDDLIKQSLVQLVLTGVGERVMRPHVGTNAYSYIFEDNDDLLQDRIQAELTQVIGQYEPRVALLGVSVVRGDQSNPATATQIEITIRYIVTATKSIGTATISLSK